MEDEIISRYGNIEVVETLRYGAWDGGTRTIYKTKIPLWEETYQSGHPLFGYISPPRFTAWPKYLPENLPKGASEMDDSDPYFGPFVIFYDALSAFNYVQGHE